VLKETQELQVSQVPRDRLVPTEKLVLPGTLVMKAQLAQMDPLDRKVPPVSMVNKVKPGQMVNKA